MIDVNALPDDLPLSLAFQVGNGNDPIDWQSAPPPTSITVRRGAGTNGSDRVTVVWPDGAIRGQWLQTKFQLPGMNQPDVFYYGSAPGDAGNESINTIVNATDEIVARNFQHSAVDGALIDDLYDYSRDGLVNGTDQIIARENQTNPLTMLHLITAPAADVVIGQAAGQDEQDPTGLSAALDWLYEFEQISAKHQANKEKRSIEATVDMLLATDWA